jgi:predicted dehydrogenase
VALIGAGIFMKETYVPNILSCEGAVRVTAILSRSEESIDEVLALLEESGSSAQKFFGSDGEDRFFHVACSICEAVVIAVPIPLIAKYVERCLALNLHVLSEKPVAANSVEAARLVSIYRQATNRTGLWHVAENYRVEPAIAFASEIVRRHPSAPKTFSLLALRQQSPTSKYAVTTWRAQPEYKGSFVLDGGIHFVALLRAVIGGNVHSVRGTYEERSVCEVGAYGSCGVAGSTGTYLIRYGAFPSPVCRLDVYWDDATMSLVQLKGVGYEVKMTGQEPRTFGFHGLQLEFTKWLETLKGSAAAELSPEEGLADLIAVELMCSGSS